MKEDIMVHVNNNNGGLKPKNTVLNNNNNNGNNLLETLKSKNPNSIWETRGIHYTNDGTEGMEYIERDDKGNITKKGK